MGWRLLVIWECEIERRPGLHSRLRSFLDEKRAGQNRNS
jgi:G:T-mismatch repair DNA endonuclease (very short patch repair protein)